MKKIKLKPGRDASLRRKHPWIFSGAVSQIEGSPVPGETVEVVSADGKWLARAAYSPKSQITARVWTFSEAQEIDREFFRINLEKAFRLRDWNMDWDENTASRLCYAESDGLPGLIIDRYGKWLSVQFLSVGPEFFREVILDLLKEMFPGFSILDRSDAEVREKEGLHPRVEVVCGVLPETFIEISEGPARFLVDLQRGHKTGFYLDQRDNRALLTDYCNDKDVLNCFSYTGGFGIYAMLAGASSVINMDTSSEALEIARMNYQVNGQQLSEGSFETADVFTALRKYRDRAEQFDVIILDPPKFVASTSQMSGGTRGYKDINLLALKLLRPGGILFTFSCSGLVGPDLFKKILADAACDAQRGIHILHHMYQSKDHPVNIHFPEGLYLKGFACRILP